jgi:hypothetical protein
MSIDEGARNRDLDKTASKSKKEEHLFSFQSEV